MPDIGEVRYKAAVDTSQVDKDINKAEEAIKQSFKGVDKELQSTSESVESTVKETSAEIKTSAKDAGDTVEDAAKDAGEKTRQESEKTKEKTKSDSKKSAEKVKENWNKAATAVGAAFAAAAAGVVAFGVKSVDLASDLQEVQNVVDTTFDGSADKIDEFAKSAGASFGLSELSAKQYTSTIGAMLKSMGLAEDETTEMSIALAGLAGDMASFYNLDPADAFEKLRSGISGETEPLKQLGINMSVANLEAFALSQGIETAYDSMDQAQQATLRYQYIMSATADAQGDFADTSDSLANQQRILQMEMDTLSATIGQKLLPFALSVVQALRDFVAWAGENGTTIGILAIAFTGLTTAIIAYSASLTLAASGMTLATAAGAVFGSVVAFLTSPITLVIAAITALVAAGVLLYQNWETVSAFASELWGNVVNYVKNAVENAKSAIENLKNSVSEKMASIGNTIKEKFESVVEFFKSLPGKAKQWGADFIQGLVDGILDKIKWVANAAKSVANTISGFLHFSRPDVGPLRNYETWMPDMAKGISKGLKSAEIPIEKASDSLAKKIGSPIMAAVQNNTAAFSFGGISPPTSFSLPSVLAADYNVSKDFSHIAAANEIQKKVLPGAGYPGKTVIEVPVILDGREIARASAWYMGEQLAWEERR